MKKFAGDIILHMCTKTIITWGTILEISSEAEFFFILGHFMLFISLPLNKPQNQNLEKMKKTPGDVII